VLIGLAVVIAGLFGIAGTFLTIEARRAAAMQRNSRDTRSDEAATWQPTSASE
jgi:hypothetical protein